jgi:hypothetical protein
MNMIYDSIKNENVVDQLELLAFDVSVICEALVRVHVPLDQSAELERQLRPIVLALDSLESTLTKLAQKALADEKGNEP